MDSTIVKNSVRVALSNLMIVFSGIVSGLVLPKILGVTDYGCYKIFNLYTTYVVFLDFGITNEYDLDFFCVTEGASVYSMKSVDKNSAIYNARQSQIKWEKENGFDPNEDWGAKQNKTVKQMNGIIGLITVLGENVVLK